MLEKLKILLNTDDESLLEVLIDMAEAEFKDYCNREDVPEAAETTIINMVRIQYARLDSQGLTSQSMAGISESYDSSFYPANVLQQMNKYRKVKLV